MLSHLWVLRFKCWRDVTYNDDAPFLNLTLLATHFSSLKQRTRNTIYNIQIISAKSNTYYCMLLIILFVSFNSFLPMASMEKTKQSFCIWTKLYETIIKLYIFYLGENHLQMLRATWTGPTRLTDNRNAKMLMSGVPIFITHI